MNVSTKLPWLIYFASGNYWTGGITGRHHILKRLSKDYNILFVNSLGLASAKRVKRSTIPQRIWLKLNSYAKYLTYRPPFYVFSPISLPLSWHRMAGINRWILTRQFKIAYQRLGIQVPSALISNPKAALLLDGLEWGKIVYWYSDKFVSYREIDNRGLLRRMDESLRAKADVIISNLQKTYDDLTAAGYGDKAIYMPHSVDFAMFNSQLHSGADKPEDMKSIAGPIVGYYGTLTDSNDWELIEYLARERPHIQFVFIGNIRSDIKNSVCTLPNVHFLGHRSYEILPTYLKCFDVCLMFWKMTDWIYNCSPLKTKEFLAMGKPVVSVRIYELERNYSDIMYLCDTKEEYLRSIDQALVEKAEMIRLRTDRVKNDSWEADAAVIKRMLEN
jgi:hypothetical protein